MQRDELSQSQAPTVTSQDTRIARSTDTRIAPALPPGLLHRATIRRSQSPQSQTAVEPLLSPEMFRGLGHINRSLHLYQGSLAQSIDQEHFEFQSLPPQIQDLVWELRKVKREIMPGAKSRGMEMEQIDTRMVQVEAAMKGLQEGFKRVSGRMDGQGSRQTQHELCTSHLHQTIQAKAAAAMGREEHLGQGLLDKKAQHQRELQNHERIPDAMMAELEANKEARERQESYIAELTQAVTSLMGQVKGKHSNPTPETKCRSNGRTSWRTTTPYNRLACRSHP